jgi:hypothetical protein
MQEFIGQLEISELKKHKRVPAPLYAKASPSKQSPRPASVEAHRPPSASARPTSSGVAPKKEPLPNIESPRRSQTKPLADVSPTPASSTPRAVEQPAQHMVQNNNSAVEDDDDDVDYEQELQNEFKGYGSKKARSEEETKRPLSGQREAPVARKQLRYDIKLDTK